MDQDGIVVGGQVISTAAVPARESFDFWTSVMSESVMPCSMEPLGDGPFSASLVPKVMADPLSMVVTANSAERARRTDQHIARGCDASVLAVLTLSGVAEIVCDDRFVRAPVGTMYLVDSERPQEARTADYEALLIRVPKETILRSAGLDADALPPVRLVAPVAHGAVVIDFFRRLITLPPETMGSVPMLNAGVELLGATLSLGRGPAVPALDREQLMTFLRHSLADPRLSTDRIAEACGMSRRKLFRVVGDRDGGPMALLRTLRAERACELLATAPDRTIGSIARACGFTGDRIFYRAFRSEIGMTPGEYRESILSSTRD
ncbi:helix-turn-helix domain-containing protein [Nocardia sp. NPDC058705]|uniref:helix-turn-helix domain-containing protein n=1 Tax=Nocardia sp. NPDC058705 TaxID=3346609 RepID=UPI003692889F